MAPPEAIYELRRSDLNLTLTRLDVGSKTPAVLGYISTTTTDPDGVAERMIAEDLLFRELPDLRTRCRAKAEQIVATMKTTAD